MKNLQHDSKISGKFRSKFLMLKLPLNSTLNLYAEKQLISFFFNFKKRIRKLTMANYLQFISLFDTKLSNNNIND